MGVSFRRQTVSAWGLLRIHPGENVRNAIGWVRGLIYIFDRRCPWKIDIFIGAWARVGGHRYLLNLTLYALELSQQPLCLRLFARFEAQGFHGGGQCVRHVAIIAPWLIAFI